MASMGLNFHVDKENATPGIVGKGSAVGFGPRKGGLSVQATPRKSLYDVNQIPASQTRTGEFLKPSGPTKLSVRPDSQINSAASQNLPGPKKISTQDSKPVVKKEVTFAQASSVSSKPKRKQQKKAAVEAEDESESEMILPKSERLSTHMHKLLQWRPSCFGTSFSSDSDDSLSDIEIPNDDFELLRPPPTSSLMDLLPEIDLELESIMADLPELEKPPPAC